MKRNVLFLCFLFAIVVAIAYYDPNYIGSSSVVVNEDDCIITSIETNNFINKGDA